MASVAVRSKLVVLLLFFDSLLFIGASANCWGGGGVKSLFWYAVLYAISSCAIILLRKRELAAILFLSPSCHVADIVLCLFLTKPDRWQSKTLILSTNVDHK